MAADPGLVAAASSQLRCVLTLRFPACCQFRSRSNRDMESNDFQQFGRQWRNPGQQYPVGSIETPLSLNLCPNLRWSLVLPLNLQYDPSPT